MVEAEEAVNIMLQQRFKQQAEQAEVVTEMFHHLMQMEDFLVLQLLEVEVAVVPETMVLVHRADLVLSSSNL
jgi:hypothetical protein